MYCLTKKILTCNSLLQKICMFLQKETSFQKQLGVGSPGTKQYIFGDYFYLNNARKLRFYVFILFHVRKHYDIIILPQVDWIHKWVPIVGPWGPELNWNKFTISCEFGPLQEKWWCHTFSSIKIEEYMEPQHSAIFWAKMVVKYIAWVPRYPLYAYEGQGLTHQISSSNLGNFILYVNETNPINCFLQKQKDNKNGTTVVLNSVIFYQTWHN